MRLAWRGLSAVAVLAVAGMVLGVRADEGEQKVPLDKLPKAVAKAVKARFPDGRMKSAEKENENGKTVYEVVVQNKGQTVEVTVTPEGTITDIEKQIAANRLPKAVADALHKKYPNASFKTVEEVIKVKDGKEKLAYYEVLLTAGGKKREVSVSPAGKVIKDEDKSKEKD